jgi:alpha-tubulin suppressor-like RCC1 family protein
MEYNKSGKNSLATKTDNTLWSWGQNDLSNTSGQLGQNNTTTSHHQYKYQEHNGVL